MRHLQLKVSSRRMGQQLIGEGAEEAGARGPEARAGLQGRAGHPESVLPAALPQNFMALVWWASPGSFYREPPSGKALPCLGVDGEPSLFDSGTA